jgi:hypothetical protein
LKTVIHADYPEHWPGLLPAIDGNLKAQDQQRIFGALHALRILTRKYEFKDEEERMPVYLIINTTFPVLLEILKYLLLLPNPAIEISDLIKLILKIFWSSAYVCYFWNPTLYLLCMDNLFQTRQLPMAI